MKRNLYSLAVLVGTLVFSNLYSFSAQACLSNVTKEVTYVVHRPENLDEPLQVEVGSFERGFVKVVIGLGDEEKVTLKEDNEDSILSQIESKRQGANRVYLFRVVTSGAQTLRFDIKGNTRRTRTVRLEVEAKVAPQPKCM